MLAFCLSSEVANAHPVAFKGSTGIMGYHSPFLTHNQINHSFEYWLAAGLHHFTRPNLGNNKFATVASVNILAKRWNENNLQANIYFNLGAGRSELSTEPETVGYGLVQFDIEDRDYYFLIKHLQLVSEEQLEFQHTVIRAGLAPYVEKFDGIHSWLILEFQHNEFLESQIVDDLTPFLRVFYRNLLFEIGQSFNGFTRFNYITHF